MFGEAFVVVVEPAAADQPGRHCCILGWEQRLRCLMHARRSLPRPVRCALGVRWLRFPPEVITLAVRWYLRFGLSYRDVGELLAERGITIDYVSIFRWVQRFTPLLAQAAHHAGTVSLR
jgi:hypothetical protein